MRNLRALPLLALVMTAACSSSSSDGSSGSPGSGDPGSGNPDDTTPCVAGVSDELLHATTHAKSRSALATGDGVIGVAYTDPKGDVAIGVVGADGTATQNALTSTVDRKTYQDYGLRMTYGNGRFAIGFDVERTTSDTHASPQTGWPSAGLVTVANTGDDIGVPQIANDDLDRTGSEGGDPVQASASTPIATSDGFFVAWSDIRTAEPIQMGVNIAGWSGIYGFDFDANGKAKMSEDAQVEQEDIAFGFAGVSTSKGILVAWGGRDSNDTQAWLTTRVGPASGDFTPATPAGPAVKLSSYTSIGLTGAVGADGKALFVWEVRPLSASFDALYAVLVDASGNLVSSTKLAESKTLSYGMATVAPTDSGYVVAYASGKDLTTFDTLHTASVDATGAVDTSNDPAQAIDGGELQGNLAASSANGRTVVYFASGAAPNLSLRSFTQCPAQ